MNTLNFSQTKPKQEILIMRNQNSKTRFDVVKVDYKQQQVDYLEKDMEYEQAVDSCKWFKVFILTIIWSAKMAYTRIEIEVISNYEYSYKVNEEPELRYIEAGREPIRIPFSGMEEMKAVAEAMLKVVEYSSNN